MIIDNITGVSPTKSTTVDLPDADAAQEFQKQSMNKVGPSYDVKTQSCVTHMGDVLRAGGVNVPKDPGAQLKYIKRLGAQEP